MEKKRLSPQLVHVGRPYLEGSRNIVLKAMGVAILKKSSEQHPECGLAGPGERTTARTAVFTGMSINLPCQKKKREVTRGDSNSQPWGFLTNSLPTESHALPCQSERTSFRCYVVDHRRARLVDGGAQLTARRLRASASGAHESSHGEHRARR